LSAIAGTRPGYTVNLSARPTDPPCYAHCEWLTGIDQPDHAHVLSVYSPNAPEAFKPKDLAAARETAFFDRLARDGGFVFLSFSGLRWFSKTPLLLSTPERSILRYDVRANEPFDDASRSDLTREVKQALAYAAIVRVLPSADALQHRLLGEAMQLVVNDLARIGGFGYAELDASTLEPTFLAPGGQRLRFDAVPTAIKHSVAFGALTLRALWAAYPGVPPERAQAVVAIDEIELHQEPGVANAIIERLAERLPNVQWVITTRSSELLAHRAPEETLALQRSEPRGVDIYDGSDARVH
jgi:hypothetical protein